jgi:hypothetical protein
MILSLKVYRLSQGQRSDIVVLFQHIARIFNKHFLLSHVEVFFKLAQGNKGTWGFVGPLEEKFEIVSNVILYVELVSRQAVSYVHGYAGQRIGLGRLLLAVVLIRYAVVGMLHDLNRKGGTKRYADFIC